MTIQIKGVDLSHHNVGPSGHIGDPIDFAAMASSGLIFACLKATQGVTMLDPTYRQRRQDAEAAGLLPAAYDFNTGDPADEQVDFFFKEVQPDASMMCALDWEDNAVSQMSLALAREYLERADDKLGRKFWIYTGNRGKQLLATASDDDKEFFGSHPWWGCEYGPELKMLDVNHQPLPWDKWSMWQFAGDGINSQGIVVPGVYRGGTVDMNTIQMSDDELRAAWIA